MERGNDSLPFPLPLFQTKEQSLPQHRQLWIARISAAVRAQGMTYGRFINALKKANVALDRKVLSDMAIKDAAGFKQLIGLAKQHLTHTTA